MTQTLPEIDRENPYKSSLAWTALICLSLGPIAWIVALFVSHGDPYDGSSYPSAGDPVLGAAWAIVGTALTSVGVLFFAGWLVVSAIRQMMITQR